MALFEEEFDKEDDKNRLFETHQKTTRSIGDYLRLLLVVSLVVIIVGGLVFYLSLPGVGDLVKAPAGLEDQIRDHLLVKEKRTAKEITVYYCGKFYWAAVDVETRPDIPGAPINLISRYRITAIQTEGSTWNITVTPVTGSEPDVPCS